MPAVRCRVKQNYRIKRALFPIQRGGWTGSTLTLWLTFLDFQHNFARLRFIFG